jgi:hypothetical protein
MVSVTKPKSENKEKENAKLIPLQILSFHNQMFSKILMNPVHFKRGSLISKEFVNFLTPFQSCSFQFQNDSSNEKY